MISRNHLLKTLVLFSSVCVPAFSQSILQKNPSADHADLLALSKRACDQALNIQPSPVVALNPIPTYTATGTNLPDSGSSQFSSNAVSVYRLGYCYEMTKNPAYAIKAQNFIDAWVNLFTGSMSKQGNDNISANGASFIIGASSVRHVGSWNDANFQGWIARSLLPYSTSSEANNHGDWGVLLEAAGAAYLNDAARLAKAKRRWDVLMASSVGADGVLNREVCRSNTNNYCGGPTQGIKGLEYTAYALTPKIVAGQIFFNNGYPTIFSESTPSGANLKKAIAKYVAWISNPSTFPYYASNNGNITGRVPADFLFLAQRVYPSPETLKAILAVKSYSMNTFWLSNRYPL